MIERLIQSLVSSQNEAADDVLLEALRLGSDAEKTVVMASLLKRQTNRGLGGIVGQFDALPDTLKLQVLGSVRQFYSALRECGRSDDPDTRVRAMRLIALGRQGKLSYVLSENLAHADEGVSRAAVEAVVALSRWVATETRGLQKGLGVRGQGSEDEEEQGRVYRELLENRPEVEAAVARAMDVYRGKHGQDLLRAALLLCDWAGSRTLAILQTAKHGGQSPMVRRLQQPPASEHVEAFLLGASHGGLRSHFGIVFSHIDEAPVLDALLRKTHWLKDHQLQLCMHQVTRGAWWGEAELAHDIERRSPVDAARIGEWLASSGVHDAAQDERMEKLAIHAMGDFDARLRLLRAAARRPKSAPAVRLLKWFLNDPDERIMRMAARELLRRRPPDFENVLLQLMTAAPDSVRRVVSRGIGQVGFDHFWKRFDRLPRETRKQAGRAMLKLLPDAVQRLARRLSGGPVEQRLKAMQITHELGLAEGLRPALMSLCTDPNPKLRSKAIAVLGDLRETPPEVLLERVLNDNDARVRANAIEVLESRHRTEYVPMLTERARTAGNRERANAIKALHRMKVGVASGALAAMLRDERAEHRISALWALRQIGWWQLLQEVGRLAREDGNLRVRRYALALLRGVADMVAAEKARKVAQ